MQSPTWNPRVAGAVRHAEDQGGRKKEPGR